MTKYTKYWILLAIGIALWIATYMIDNYVMQRICGAMFFGVCVDACILASNEPNEKEVNKDEEH